MGSQKFRHDSLQDPKALRALLEDLGKNIEKGTLRLSEGDDILDLAPDGLISLRIKAERDEGQCQLSLKLTWTQKDAMPQQKPLPKLR